jgi:hypothetical protein
LPNLTGELGSIAGCGDGGKGFQELLEETRVGGDLSRLQGRVYLAAVQLFQGDGATQLGGDGGAGGGSQDQFGVTQVDAVFAQAEEQAGYPGDAGDSAAS